MNRMVIFLVLVMVAPFAAANDPFQRPPPRVIQETRDDGANELAIRIESAIDQLRERIETLELQARAASDAAATSEGESTEAPKETGLLIAKSNGKTFFRMSDGRLEVKDAEEQ